MPIAVQEAMAAHADASTVHHLDADRSPMLSRTEELAELLTGLATRS